ncbi:hypothetical protein FNW02_13230 [Komarekiella sp. 'clone 1']|uniref:Uncharacterized protein n=1 Tax=Komarekiella delphini-convector SJRDD-AB1 TaxID=2593771 RepID=A0AA40SXB3_9NOST|nr:hypothetical protein [Komarekiella delphini-convector]MBD6616764.1 hypothetical protein [Komarekiella delphini-convector SJRDD-AB1]
MNDSINQRILDFWQTAKVLKVLSDRLLYSLYSQKFCNINNTLCKELKCNDTVRVLNSTENNLIHPYRTWRHLTQYHER